MLPFIIVVGESGYIETFDDSTYDEALVNQLYTVEKNYMPERLSIAIGQLNSHLGDISGNLEKIKKYVSIAAERFRADLVVFPELALTGYPPEDLLFHSGLQRQVKLALAEIKALSHDIGIIIGFPDCQKQVIYNAAVLYHKNRCELLYHKQQLPNYGVFDEKRYFQSGSFASVVSFKGCTLGLLICEDIWSDFPVRDLHSDGAELVISINASPFDYQKLYLRQHLLQQHSSQHQLAMLYVQAVGAQDELVFDGGSMAVNARGCISYTAPFYEEVLLPIYFERSSRDFFHHVSPPVGHLSEEAQIYNALVIGIKDYVNKNGFNSVVLGLSGGVDSALTLMLAVDALGADNVNTVMMPSTYTSQMSLDDAERLACNAKVRYMILPISEIYHAFINILEPIFCGTSVGVTEENLQARCRGVLLMALANKYGWLTLTTGNKSEMAVGYTTLYGDMVGGFAALKDVPKLLVYRLANFRNQQGMIIPERIITRPPSAELSPGQIDCDNLPSYDVLDAIIEYYIEQDMDRDLIIAQGYSTETVDRVLGLIDRSEYKRRQSAPGVRITPRALSRDRRFPITNGFCHKQNYCHLIFLANYTFRKGFLLG